MDITRTMTILIAILVVVFWIGAAAVFIYMISLIIRALRKYINGKEIREEKNVIRKSLGELLKENRLRCKMTQEFVAETLGVSRQAVSRCLPTETSICQLGHDHFHLCAAKSSSE